MPLRYLRTFGRTFEWWSKIVFFVREGCYFHQISKMILHELLTTTIQFYKLVFFPRMKMCICLCTVNATHDYLSIKSPQFYLNSTLLPQSCISTFHSSMLFYDFIHLVLQPVMLHPTFLPLTIIYSFLHNTKFHLTDTVGNLPGIGLMSMLSLYTVS